MRATVLNVDCTPVYNYDLAIPVMRLHFSSTQNPRPSLTALPRHLHVRAAGRNVTAFNTVWTSTSTRLHHQKSHRPSLSMMVRMATIERRSLHSSGPRLLVTNFNNILTRSTGLLHPSSTLHYSPPSFSQMFWNDPRHAAFHWPSLVRQTAAALTSPAHPPSDAAPASTAAGQRGHHTPATWPQNFGPPLRLLRHLLVTIAVSLVTSRAPNPKLVASSTL